jgi:hypothetical protein
MERLAENKARSANGAFIDFLQFSGVSATLNEGAAREAGKNVTAAALESLA